MSLSGDSSSLPWNAEPRWASISHPVHFLPSSFCFIDLPVEMKSFLNPLIPALQAFHAVPGCKNAQPGLGAPRQSSFAEDHPRDTLKTQIWTKKSRARLFCSSRLALGPNPVTCKSSPVQCWAPAMSFARAGVMRTVQVLKILHWEFCCVNLTVNYPFVSHPLQKTCINTYFNLMIFLWQNISVN